MELFNKLFGSLLLLVYHCFDRVVINGYLSALSRPEQVVAFFREVVGERAITKEVLAKRTQEYRAWVDAFARNHQTPFEWAEKKVRKEDYVRPHLRRWERQQKHGVYFIFKSMEQGRTFRSSTPKFPTKDPDYRILAKQRSRFTHYYFYIRDETLGAFVMRVGSFFPFEITYFLNGHNFIEKELMRIGVRYRKSDNAFLSVSDPAALQAAADSFSTEVIRERLAYWTLVLGPKFSKRERQAFNLHRFYAVTQIEYCQNFIFKRNFPIRKLFERSCELGLWHLTGDRISQFFGIRLTRLLKGKLNSTLEKFDHGHHIFRAYWKNAFIKQYEKFSTFLRNEVCSNNLADFRLKKGLDHLPAVRSHFLAILDRFTDWQAQALNVHVDFPLFQRLALPITCGSTKVPRIKLHDTRIIRLFEVMLHAGTTVSGWSAAHLHHVLIQTYRLSPDDYRLSQLRYDLRKLKAHGLIQRDGKHYRYRLTDKGLKVALLFLFFHKRIAGPIAHSLFHHRPDSRHQPKTQLEAAYHKADQSIDKIINLLNAA